MDNLLQTTANPVDGFVAGVERQVLLMAELATRNTVDAMEILDASVRKWVRKHSQSPQAQWHQSFYGVLEHAINDFLRRQMPFMQWFSSRSEIQFWQDLGTSTIDMSAEKAEFHKAVLVALAHLSLPQQQTFLLCGWLGFSVADAAVILAEPVATIASRYGSAAAGMKEALVDFAGKQNNPPDEHLLVRICQVLDESVANVSYVQQHQLRAIRRQASHRQQSRSYIQWFLVTAVMGLCLFVFWSLQVPDQSGDQLKELYPLQNPQADSLQPWREDTALLENLPFFLWLAMQEDTFWSDQPVPAASLPDKELYSRWDRLPASRKAVLREHFQSFSSLTFDMQKAVRSRYLAYQQLPAESRNHWLLEWQALDKVQKAALWQLYGSGKN